MLEAPTGPFIVPPLTAPTAALWLSLVIPTFNEARNLPSLLPALYALLEAALPAQYEIIVVDDDSPDRTWEIAQTLAQTLPTLRVMRRRAERGLSSAVIRGWQVARGQNLAVIDGDRQHPSEALLSLSDRIREGADVVVASRHIEGGGVSDWSLRRRIISRAAQVVGLMVLPDVVGRTADPMSGYFVIRRAAIENITLQPLGYKILIEVLGRGRIHSIAEVPYVFNERIDGQSKVTMAVYVDYLRHLTTLRLSRLPLTRLIRFAVVGMSGVVVDMSLLYALSDPAMGGWGLTRSKLIAAEIAIINNFIWNDLWTFGDIASRQRGAARRGRRFLKFQAICLMGLVANTVLLNLQYNLLGINRYVANAIAIALVTVWNFWLNWKLSWRATES